MSNTKLSLLSALFLAIIIFLFTNGFKPLAQGKQLPADTSSLFSGSGKCNTCHNANGVALTDSAGNDLTMAKDWRSTMMANAARDPYWQAKVESEVSVNPQLKDIIENKCVTCHMPMGRTQAIWDGAAYYSLDEGRMNNLAMDGVSCTVCHQIQSTGLGSDSTFSGAYVIDSSRVIYGPYDDESGLGNTLMQSAAQFGIAKGEHLQKSELCASCHTLYTPYLDDAGNIAGEFPEQMAYFEWKSSVHAADSTQCQDCHMPRADDPIIISSVPANSPARSPFWQHRFVGGNAFMLEMLKEHGMDLGVTADDVHFDSTIAFTRHQLRHLTARLSAQATADTDTLIVNINIENLTGHKFPTGFPSRRTWLRVLVTNENDNIVYESGGYNEDGTIRNLNPENSYELHHDRITSENQVQIYESTMIDVNGDVTRTLLRGAEYVKDNRLPPKGFTTSAEHYDDMAIKGVAASDGNFNLGLSGEGSGSDSVTYAIDISGQTGELQVFVELLFQTIKPDFVSDIAVHDTPAVDRFVGYYDAADKTPELVQSALLEVDLVTGIAGRVGSGVPETFGLLPNYPNPFNASTVIPYTIASSTTDFELAVYDLRGRRVRVLASGVSQPGAYAVNWDGRDDLGTMVSSGVYVYRLITATQTIARKLVLLK